MNPPRILFVAMPPEPVRLAIAEVVSRHGLDKALGSKLSPSGNWHQSLSERTFHPDQALIDRLLGVGAAVQANACTMQNTRIDSSLNQKGRVHVTLRGGSKKLLDPLNQAVQQQLLAAGQVEMATGVTPHVTLSYNAPRLLPAVPLQPPLQWTLDELLLVIGHGDPYRYDVVGRWPLLAERDPPPTQMGLF